jgi:hypothetical protein
VPQVLKYYEAIEYTDDLKTFLKRNAMLSSGARFEVEIRAASIVACHVSLLKFFIAIFVFIVIILRISILERIKGNN